MEAPEVSEKSCWDHFGLYIVLLNIHSNTSPYITLHKATFLQSFQCLTQVRTPRLSSSLHKTSLNFPSEGYFCIGKCYSTCFTLKKRVNLSNVQVLLFYLQFLNQLFKQYITIHILPITQHRVGEGGRGTHEQVTKSFIRTLADIDKKRRIAAISKPRPNI